MFYKINFTLNIFLYIIILFIKLISKFKSIKSNYAIYIVCIKKMYAVNCTSNTIYLLHVI